MNKELLKLVEICHSNAKNSPECLKYLSSRGFFNDTIENYKIGYFPQNINTLGKYVDLEVLKEKKIIKYDNNSDFRDYHYLIIPIFDEYGNIQGICGRTLIDSKEIKLLKIPKYKNSAYKKKNFLFGLDKSYKSIVNKKSVWIVEGYFDQISMFNYGAKNCVGLGGTAFSKNHFLKMSRYCNKFNFIYDNDEAGLINSERVYKKFCKYGMKLDFYKIKDFKDIDEYLFYNKTLKNLKNDVEKISF